MLTINDLHRQQELSSSGMRKVGGASALTEAAAGALEEMSILFKHMGCYQAQDSVLQTAGQVLARGL
jgi:hypothetical protein